MKRILKLATLSLALVAPGALAASEVALIVGNSNYRNIGDLRHGAAVLDAATRLKRAGVDVLVAEDQRLRDLRAMVRQFAQVAPKADGVLVVLSGRFVHSATETYFLPSDSNSPSLVGLPSEALSLSVVLAILAEAPGEAFLVLATDETTGEVGSYLREGIGDVEAPQGVTLIEGRPRATAALLRDVIARENGDLLSGIVGLNGVRVSGYLPKGHAFLSDDIRQDRPLGDAIPFENPEDTYWTAAQDLQTIEGYKAYLERFPRGKYAIDAQAAIDEIRSTPGRLAEAEEERLGLTRDQRREIQRALSLLDFNTRGIDGIFGRGTRSAIAAFQGENGFQTTGFITRNQVVELSRQAKRKAVQLEAEAEERRIAQAREDRAYWRQTGALGDESGFREYLKRFPDGRYSEIANARLKSLEEERRKTTNARETQFWDRVTQANTIDAYNSYLFQLPNGIFAEEARSRIAALKKQSQVSPQVRQAALDEERMNLNGATRRVVEQRLNAMGLKPGPVDGKFDEKTRRAVRRFQQERGLAVTGYLDEAAIVRILAESIFQ